jgi:CubicO group peptidase (beta-lactamase class C family)
MKKILIFLIVLSIGISCKLNKIEQTPALQYDNTYREAVFQDTDRLEKISRLLPALDTIFAKFALANHIPGLSYGLIVDGRLMHTYNYGFSDIDKKIPVSSKTLFRVASMSKSLAAMAILKLRDQGKLHLEDPAHQYIPQLKDIKYPTADSPPITIWHLLTHGAGFPEDNPWGDRQLADTDKDFMEFLSKQVSFSNSPGIAYEYSNLGFALLGKIINKVSGVRYQDYIRREIWEPLGMHSSTYEFSDVPADQLALGYRWLNEKWNLEELLHDAPDGSWGAMGSMISSVEEFGSYAAFHLSAWPPGNSKETGPAKRSTIREMHHPWRWSGTNTDYTYSDGRKCAMTFAYAYGLRWMSDCNNKTYVGHSGGLPGFGSNWNIMPDYGIGVVSLGNRTYSPMSVVNLIALDTLVKGAGLKPRQLPPSRILEQRKNELIQVLPDWNNAVSVGIFAENFFPDYPLDSLRKEAKTLFSKAGSIKSVSAVNPMNQLRGTFIMEGENANLEIFFTLSPENPPLIQEYRIRETPRRQ